MRSQELMDPPRMNIPRYKELAKSLNKATGLKKA